MVVLGSLLSPKCCLSYPTKRTVHGVAYFSSASGAFQGPFYMLGIQVLQNQVSMVTLADYQTTRVPNVSSPCLCPGKHLLRAWHIMETLGHRNKAVSAAMAFTDSQSLSQDTAQVGLHRVGGLFFFLIFEVRSYKMVGGIYSPNWQEKCRLYPRYSPCLRFGGYRIPITYYQNQNNPMIGEIFGEPVCDRIIWELQYLLRNYPRFLHVMGKFGSRITLWWSDMIW